MQSNKNVLSEAEHSLFSASNTFRKPLFMVFTKQEQEIMQLNAKTKLDKLMAANNISGMGNKNTSLTVSSAVA